MNLPNEPTPSLVVISGASGGLGKAFAVECAARGWSLLLTDLRAEPLETLAAGLRRASSVTVLTHPCDLSSANQRAELRACFHRAGLRVWMLINVAGLDHEGPFCHLTSQQLLAIVRVNIEGTLDLTHGLLEQRDPRATLRIINVASLAAFYPMPVKATYAASKRFLLDFSLALNEELRGLGATVTALCPAGMPTNAETLRAIRAQGWLGQITTLDTGRVASQTLDAALAGRQVVVPGWSNRALQCLGGLVPRGLLARLIASRWSAARRRRGLSSTAQPLRAVLGEG
ncbi:MAG: SDR family NAD(P)-dependent oxidoreductase [Chloroflexota bacterium]|jgi:short-subunit dehydrogenase